MNIRESVSSCSLTGSKKQMIVTRDNPRDSFDIYLISKFYEITFNDVLNILIKKTKLDDSDLIIS